MDSNFSFTNDSETIMTIISFINKGYAKTKLIITKHIVNFDYLPLTKNEGADINYQNSCCDEIKNNIETFLKNVNINYLTITCNSICMGDSMTKDATELLININDYSTSINVYDSNKLIDIVNINYGMSNIYSRIQDKIKIDNVSEMYDTVNEISCINDTIPMVNIFENNLSLSYTEITNKTLVNLFASTLKKFMDTNINDIIIDLCNKYMVSNKYINGKNNELIAQCLSNKCVNEFLPLNKIEYECFFNNIININDLLMIIYYVDAHGDGTYSIIPYTDQNTFDKQFYNNLFLKIGVISTKFSAGIGDEQS
jgi:hypothetical protein